MRRSACGAVASVTRNVCARGQDGFVTVTVPMHAVRRVGRRLSACRGGCCSTHRIYCTCVLKRREGSFETGSGKRPSNATKGPVLKRVGSGRLASVLVVIIHCFKNVGLKADKLVITCGTTTTRTVTTTSVIREAISRRVAMSFRCPFVGSVVHVIGRSRPTVLRRSCSVSYLVELQVHGSVVKGLHTHLRGIRATHVVRWLYQCISVFKTVFATFATSRGGARYNYGVSSPCRVGRVYGVSRVLRVCQACVFTTMGGRDRVGGGRGCAYDIYFCGTRCYGYFHATSCSWEVSTKDA